MSPLTTLLSQHELMCLLCRYISSADIVHLSATSRIHRLYMTSSQPIYKQIMSEAICDGTGIIAQERVFAKGGFPGPSTLVENKCLIADCKPCSECGAQVFDVRDIIRHTICVQAPYS